MKSILTIVPHQLLVKKAELKLQLLGIKQKIKELDTVESKIINWEYLLTSNIKKTINIKDFLDNLVTLNTKEITSDTRNPDGSFNFTTIVSIEACGYNPGDKIKFYTLDKELDYLKPTGYSFKFKKKFFKEYNHDVEDEYTEYLSVCNYFYSLKCKLLNEYKYDNVVYFTVNDSKEVTRLIIGEYKNGNK